MRARRTDGNHKAVLEALRRLGYPCKSLHTQGGGVEDILVGMSRVELRWIAGGPFKVMVRLWVLLEMKVAKNQQGTTQPSQFTRAQKEWYAKTLGFPRVVAVSAEDAIRQLRALAG